jgi:hypothetical protein
MISPFFNKRTIRICFRGILATIIFISCFQFSKAQKVEVDTTTRFKISLKKAVDKIIVDGKLNEESWNRAEAQSDFWQNYPNDDRSAKLNTQVKLTFDEDNLYVAFISHGKSDFIIQSLKRDSDPIHSEGVGVVLDPQNNKNNGFFFAVNPYNVQSEDLLAADGAGNITFSWDNVWNSMTSIGEDTWIAEIAIPFKTLRYSAEKKLWGINFVRFNPKDNEISTWTKIPVNMGFYDFGYTGNLIWEDSPPLQKRNLVLNPYITGSVGKNAEEGKNLNGNFTAGVDAKIGINSKLNLDLTVNPDFSQVEVDKQVTNLTRFNLFFPEKRTFFQENSDLYSNYGTSTVKPFYSRRIGLDNDGNSVPILSGARLSGSINDRTRIALMNIQTRKQGEFAAQNYTAISVNRTYFKRSFVKAYYFGREGFTTPEQDIRNPLDKYGRNIGIESLFISDDNRWNVWGGVNKSFKHQLHTQDNFMYTGFQYTTRKLKIEANYEDVGKNYYADMGYIQRLENYDALRDTVIRAGYRSFFNKNTYTLYPKSGSIVTHTFSVASNFYLNRDATKNEYNNTILYESLFKTTAVFSVGLNHYDLRLLFPISFSPPAAILEAKDYKYDNFTMSYNSDRTKEFNYGLSVMLGGFYNGKLQRYTASVKYRQQPWGNFGLEFEQNELQFPLANGKASLLLISPKVELNFSTRLFWTTFFQYNTQADNFNINSRLQWRYKQMSDIYIVYTDNSYNSPFFKNKNRALVFKMNYWF